MESLDLGQIVTSIVALAATIWLLPWLRSRAAHAKTTAQRDRYLAALAIVDAAAAPAVAATEQTVMRRLRSAAAGAGLHLSDEQAEHARALALELTYDALGHNGRVASVCKALGVDAEGLRKIVATRIEANLLDLKIRTGAASSATTRRDAVLSAEEHVDPAGDSGEILPPGE